MISKSTLFVATAIAAGLVSAVKALPPPKSTDHDASVRPAVVTSHFATCTAMRRVWPHGVGLASARDRVADPARDRPVTDFHHSRSLYDANRRLDHDGDHIACEAN